MKELKNFKIKIIIYLLVLKAIKNLKFLPQNPPLLLLFEHQFLNLRHHFRKKYKMNSLLLNYAKNFLKRG